MTRDASVLRLSARPSWLLKAIRSGIPVPGDRTCLIAARGYDQARLHLGDTRGRHDQACGPSASTRTACQPAKIPMEPPAHHAETDGRQPPCRWPHTDHPVMPGPLPTVAPSPVTTDRRVEYLDAGCALPRSVTGRLVVADPVPDAQSLWAGSPWGAACPGQRWRCRSLRFLIRLPQVAMSHQAPARLWDRS
jgi:hypothetical protein